MMSTKRLSYTRCLRSRFRSRRHHAGASVDDMNGRGWLGANMGQMTSSSRMPLFANIVSMMRGFAQDGAYAVLTTPLDANGWPTAACTMILSAGSTTGAGQVNNGAYLMKWKEGASPGIVTASGTGWAITGRTIVGAGPYYTGTLTVTDRTQSIAPTIGATGISEVEIMQPGLSPGYSSAWNPDALDYWAQYNVIRTMKNSGVERIPLPEGVYTFTFTGGGAVAVSGGSVNGTLTNSGQSPCDCVVLRGSDFTITTSGTVTGLVVSGGPVAAKACLTNGATTLVILPTSWTWAQRQTVKNREACYSRTREIHGMGIEEQVDFANQVYARSGSKLKCMWFNVWHHADDTFITNYLTYIRDNLNPALSFFLELGNELWNRQFYHSANWFYQLAQDEIAAGGSDLNFDGGVGGLFPGYWGFRMGARRAVEMSVIAQSVFGGSFGSRCKPVLGTQLSSANVPISKTYYLESVRGVNLKATFPGGLAMSLYTFLPATGGSGGQLHGKTAAQMVNYYDTDATNGRPGRIATIALFQEVAGRHGLNMVAYEGGPDQSGASSFIAGVTQADLIEVCNALASTAMGTHITNLIADWMTYSGKTFVFFSGGVQADPLPLVTSGALQNMTSWFDAQDSAVDNGSVGIAPGYTPKARLIGVRAARSLVVPPPASQNIVCRCPGTITPINFPFSDRSIFPNNTPVWSLTSTTPVSNAINDTIAPLTGRWVERAFYATAGTYAMTNRIRCNNVATFTYAIDGVTVQTFAGVNTGGDPFGSAAIAQTPVSVTLTEGWHKLRVSIDCSVSAMRAGFGPTTFV